MRTKEEIEKLSSIEAYNLALEDAKKVSTRLDPSMRGSAVRNNVAARDNNFFEPDPEELDNLKVS